MLARRRDVPGRPESATSSAPAFVVSPQLFETTGYLLDSPGALSLAMIERLTTKRPTSTYITFVEWRAFARETMQLSEASCLALFDAFHTLSSRVETRVENSRLLLGKMGSALDESRYRTAAATRVVSLPGFTLFLMAQLQLEKQRHADTAQEVLNFVKQNINFIVSTVGVTKPGHVSQKDALELGLLLREYANGTEQPFGTSLGMLWQRDERVIDSNVLAQYLKPRIVPASEVRGVSGNVVVSGGGQSSVQTVAAPFGAHPTRFPGNTFLIQNASQTSFYVPSTLPSTTVSGLANCTILLGPVSGVLHVRNCEHCVISAVCGAVIVTNVKHVTLFVCTNTPPILIGVNPRQDGVFFAPFNTHYAALEEHIAASGLNPKLNLWRCGLQESCILPPAQFVAAAFPIAPTSAPTIVTRSNPCPLPREYQEALMQRVTTFNATSAMLQGAYRELEGAGRKDLADDMRAKVQRMFLDWATDKGQIRGVIDLMHNNTHPHVQGGQT